MAYTKLEKTDNIRKIGATIYITLDADKETEGEGIDGLGQALGEREDRVLNNNIRNVADLMEAINASIDEDLDHISLEDGAENFQEGELNEIWDRFHGTGEDIESSSYAVIVNYTKSSHYSEQDIIDYLERHIQDLQEEDAHLYRGEIEEYQRILATA